MSGVFGAGYAAAYDALYADKDYDAEVALLEKVFNASGRQIRTVLDLGCGTGAHAARLASRGYDVVGVDLSDAMLDAARRREGAVGSGRLEYVQGDIRSVRLDREFDAVVCMFAVLGYQIDDEDVSQTLRTVRHHLVEGGPFVFDVWYGPAVEAIRPSARTRVVASGDSEIERHASAEIEPDAHVCTVSYRLIKRHPGRPDEIVNEAHRMRYFFQDELTRFLASSSMSLVQLSPFPDADRPLTADAWNAMGVAM
jgi:SAM-dependent methyltransferase